jgi:hypothetical protein
MNMRNVTVEWMCVWKYGCKHRMYCDESTNATNIPFGTNVPRAIEIDLPSNVKKIRDLDRRPPS